MVLEKSCWLKDRRFNPHKCLCFFLHKFDFYNEYFVMLVSMLLPNNMQEQLHLDAVVTLVAKVRNKSQSVRFSNLWLVGIVENAGYVWTSDVGLHTLSMWTSECFYPDQYTVQAMFTPDSLDWLTEFVCVCSVGTDRWSLRSQTRSPSSSPRSFSPSGSPSNSMRRLVLSPSPLSQSKAPGLQLQNHF